MTESSVSPPRHHVFIFYFAQEENVLLTMTAFKARTGFQLQGDDQPELRRTTDTMIREIVAVQEPSDYLNTYFAGDRKPLRIELSTQTTGHQLYCICHMLQGAIAYYHDRKTARDEDVCS